MSTFNINELDARARGARTLCFFLHLQPLNRHHATAGIILIAMLRRAGYETDTLSVKDPEADKKLYLENLRLRPGYQPFSVIYCTLS